jgi:Fe-S oxidoreductase
MSESMTGRKAADGVKSLLERERAELLSKCTQCGRCFEVCPMVQYGDGLAGRPSREVVGGVLDILRDRPGSPAALEWVKLCAKSGECDAHCPEAISPKMMLRLARIIALGGMGGAAAPQWPLKDDPDYFNKVHAYARLSLSEEERAAWTVAPLKREP